ncbi:sensor histidine kinase [Lactiplantibacillus pentosus]|uniref:sensor histidine kinase n=2 Tax=Lactiplantibacillus pentosus TaxID=1589 RepID=UPI0031E55E48
MLNIEIIDAFFQGTICVLTILIWYYYCINKLNLRTWMQIIVRSLLLGAASVLISDVTYLIIVLMILLKQIIQSHRLDYTRLSIMIFIVNIQIIMSNIAVYITRWALTIVNNTNEWQKVYGDSHVLIVCYFVATVLMNVFIIALMKRYSSEINALVDKIKYVAPKHIFGMLLILFVAIEGISIISLVKQVTAVIQVPLIMAFSIMMIMMLWQMYFFISSYTKKQAADYQAQQNAQLNDYLKSVERQYLELRKFKHDYKNLMLSLQDSLTNGNSPEQTEYFKELIAQSAVETSLDSGKIVKVQHLGNETLRGLIVQKFLDAQAQGINLTVELNTENFVIHHELVDIIRIVGNLLDNAIEATQATADKQVICAFNTLNGTKEISVRNPTNQKIDANKVFELGVSTKGAQRGFGLSNVHQLVAQHRNFFLDMNSQDNQVVMTLTVVEED